MEMQEIAIEGESKGEGEIKGKDEGAAELVVEAKPEEEAKPHHYDKLQSPSENVYAEAFYSGAPGKIKQDSQTDRKGKTRLYRLACVILSLICLVLLLVVIILGVKLRTGTTACPEIKESTAPSQQTHTCNFDRCQALFPNVQLQYLGCRQCADDWQTFGRSCFYLSTFRLNWDESQRNCSSRGGSLAVISSPEIQGFLTSKGKMKYWIGLRQRGLTWGWVNNTVLGESYWADVTSNGDCGILSSDGPAERNWIKASCQSSSYFICQLKS
ncbi:C-type lectin domain family 9 member A isoform X1 [Xyrichtys novacula]|uniref:C-type lectin domain family 9 member A isoform X1 n=1 Tax=Xyrichtys novacula TaxID=13765 RepID=A0AAV1FNU9_XYRNO|nr:C-type lectin domain family 9 member A isoform X1 [Xyrichtys novacula]